MRGVSGGGVKGEGNRVKWKGVYGTGFVSINGRVNEAPLDILYLDHPFTNDSLCC